MTSDESPIDELETVAASAARMLPAESRPPELEAHLRGFLALLLERNREVNLVSRRDTEQHVARFSRECLFLARILLDERQRRPDPKGAPRLLDIGSGNGFPGILLKLAIPDLEIHLVEGTRKKARFLAEVAERLELRDTSVLWARAEVLARTKGGDSTPDLRRRFDWVTGKGLGSLRASTELAGPFLVPGGVHWTFKGKACKEEIEAASGLFRQRGFAVHRTEPIPDSEDSWVVGVRRLARS